MYYIYLYTNIMTGEQYVGQTNNIERRDKEHRRNTGKTYFDNVYSKHPENFILQILKAWHDISEEVLDEEEIFWIAHLHTKYPNGYNLTDGGGGSRGYELTDEIRKKYSEAAKKRWEDPEYRKNVIEHRPNISGENHHWYGKKHTEESRQKQSESAYQRWEKQEEHDKMCAAQQKRWENPEEHEKNKQAQLKYWEEHPEKREEKSNEVKQYYKEHPERAMRGGKHPSARKVYAIDYELKFDSRSDAVRYLKLHGYPKAIASNITQCCKNQNKKVYGSRWIDYTKGGECYVF